MQMYKPASQLNYGMFTHLSKEALRAVCRFMIIIHRVSGQWSCWYVRPRTRAVWDIIPQGGVLERRRCESLTVQKLYCVAGFPLQDIFIARVMHLFE